MGSSLPRAGNTMIVFPLVRGCSGRKWTTVRFSPLSRLTVSMKPTPALTIFSVLFDALGVLNTTVLFLLIDILRTARSCEQFAQTHRYLNCRSPLTDSTSGAMLVVNKGAPSLLG